MILGLRRAQISPSRQYPFPDLAQITSVTAGLQALPGYPLFVPEDAQEQARELIQRHGLTVDHPWVEVERVLSQHLEVLSPAHIATMIDHLPTHADVRTVLTALFADPHHDLARYLLLHPPNSIEIARFRGDDGRLLLASGDLRRCRYQGLLVRILGEGEPWDGNWRVFSVQAEGLANHLPPRP